MNSNQLFQEIANRRLTNCLQGKEGQKWVKLIKTDCFWLQDLKSRRIILKHQIEKAFTAYLETQFCESLCVASEELKDGRKKIIILLEKDEEVYVVVFAEKEGIVFEYNYGIYTSNGNLLKTAKHSIVPTLESVIDTSISYMRNSPEFRLFDVAGMLEFKRIFR